MRNLGQEEVDGFDVDLRDAHQGVAKVPEDVHARQRRLADLAASVPMHAHVHQHVFDARQRILVEVLHSQELAQLSVRLLLGLPVQLRRPQRAVHLAGLHGAVLEESHHFLQGRVLVVQGVRPDDAVEVVVVDLVLLEEIDGVGHAAGLRPAPLPPRAELRTAILLLLQLLFPQQEEVAVHPLQMVQQHLGLVARVAHPHGARYAILHQRGEVVAELHVEGVPTTRAEVRRLRDAEGLLRFETLVGRLLGRQRVRLHRPLGNLVGPADGGLRGRVHQLDRHFQGRQPALPLLLVRGRRVPCGPKASHKDEAIRSRRPIGRREANDIMFAAHIRQRSRVLRNVVLPNRVAEEDGIRAPRRAGGARAGPQEHVALHRLADALATLARTFRQHRLSAGPVRRSSRQRLWTSFCGGSPASRGNRARLGCHGLGEKHAPASTPQGPRTEHL
mmetsp:Transcript_7120/g.27277  ORF Transcript_7120/g.27277 Transcript_7120/m.27277 type:complete len:446 (+) Transcript_7120:2590-3927(+)